MKKALFAIFALFPPLLFAAPNADVSLTASVTPTTVAGGDTATVTAHIVNAGPEEAGDTSVVFGFDVGYATSISAPGWTCSNNNLGLSVTCRRSSLPVSSSDLAVTVLSNIVKPTPFYVAVYPTATDPTPNDHSAPLELNVIPSGVADIRIENSHEPHLVPRGSTATFVSIVHNNGPSATGDVFVDDNFFGLPQDFTISNVSASWSCSREATTAVRCQSTGMAPYSSRELRYSVQVPDALIALTRYSAVHFRAATLPTSYRNWAQDGFAIGTSDDFERILLPVVMAETPGSFGSRWISRFVAMADAEDILLFPRPDYCQVTCPIPPPYGYPVPRFPFEPYLLMNFTDPSNPARLLYTLKGTSQHLHMNLRVQDLSRQSQTWGTEIPIIRESEAKTGRIELLNVPLNERFRQTLRFYDLDSRGDSQVRVRLFGTDYYGGETAVAEVLLTLAAPVDDNIFGTAIGLPVRPGYARLDGLLQRFPALSNYTTLRVEIEPVTAGLRYWAFASITNNETQHVTTITPQ